MVSVPVGKDTVLAPSKVTALKESVSLELIPSPVSRINLRQVETGGIFRQGKLSGMIPGLHIPDYGASLTSTIYLRGLGSRMENPVMGLYIDGIPVLDKNMYDVDWLSVSSATMLRGPQGTLYGRNSMGGVLDLRTFSPTSLDKTIFSFEYGTANSLRANGVAAFGNNVVSVGFRHTDGYFINEYKGKPCDPYKGLTAMWKWENDPASDLALSNSLSVSASREGGFAYGLVEDGTRRPVSYNGESGYDRISVLEGLRGRYSGDSFIIDGTVSAQLFADKMVMDQDYTPMDIFTLAQEQKSGSGTIEIVLRKKEGKAFWQPLTGLFAFGRYTAMHAPVTFKRDGIETLILDNANRNIPSQIGHLEISDNQFPVDSDFGIMTAGAAIFHESTLEKGHWRLSAGARLDYETAFMNYDCLSSLHYRFVPTMASDKPFSLPYSGSLGHSRIQVLPKFSAMFNASEGLYLFATFSGGSRAGGFNTQIFSDILQNMMMNGIMSDLGVHLDRPAVSVGAGNTEYDPELAWNHEVGLRFSKGGFHTEASVYLIN
ncbi:MAG: TonB-dependent receptor, partial [Bacteroidales bacterium]|nr:TonB-dependent receptor [Bacteroidales bacterium]